MRILALSGAGPHPDEGQKKVASNLVAQLSKRHTVWHAHARRSLSTPRFWRDLIAFRPHVIHVFLRPGVSSLLLACLVRIAGGSARTVISALQPPKDTVAWKAFASLLAPDLVLTLSKQTEHLFQEAGCKTAFLRCGVDVDRFVPVDAYRKSSLREKYGIGRDDFVILHVGHLTEGRNLLVLTDLQRLQHHQVFVVYSPAFKPHPGVYRRLIDEGCILLGDYLERIEEVYQLADCYLFPVVNPSYCIELPLSVLEAMSCDLPVITARFGALDELFQPGDGLFYLDSSNSIRRALECVTRPGCRVRNRERVADYGWGCVARDLERVYAQLLADP